ncbi:MAG: phosphate acyltransferase PlsX [Oscillospiraceae bacterium]|nr:phosphate acyltransferase PlsX [Oscillospiraceae bacterium]MDY4192529.1 phosphate acyltransferase PlsX [Oscillospiraceae bacterium]
MKIIVDAFGGDNAPLEVLKGCRMAADELQVSVVLTGDEAAIRKCAGENGISLDGMEIVHASQVMDMEADPTEIRTAYRDSSMAVGMRLLADGQGDAFVSAGSTGAFVVGASTIVRRIKGIKRAALAPIIPSAGGKFALVDCGANVECRPEMLVQFGIMGSIYMEKILGVKNPRVGLVNVGVEETKGDELRLETYRRLQLAPVNFIGNVEARELPKNGCDVAVCDGFTGNVILKLTEGLSSALIGQIKGVFYKNIGTKLAALCLKKGMMEFKKTMDYTEYGGSMLIGISKPVIKAHGSSNAKAFKNAVRQAARIAGEGVIPEIEKALAQMKETGGEA